MASTRFADDNGVTRLEGSLSGIVPATSVGGVTVTGTPSAGQVLTATSATAADWEAGGGSATVLVATKVLANAQVLALPTTPVQVFAAPGASKIAVPLHATLRVAWTADYTGIDVTAALYLLSGTGLASARLEQTVDSAVSGLLAGGGPDGTVAWIPAAGSVPASVSTTSLQGVSSFYDSDVSNKAILLAATNALDFTGGNAANTLTVTLLYYVVSF